MKKHYFNFLLAFAASLLLFNQSCSVQKGTVTSKTATVSNGYTVMNPQEAIKIYKYEHLGHSAKEADKYEPKYYFTTASSDDLIILNKTNLKQAFSSNHPYHDALDANFTKDEELINYDDFHKMYKINRLLLNDSHSNNMKMDNSMMASMNTSMGKMHNMKMSADFDHDFAHMMIMHHQAGIDMSEIEMAKGTDAQVKKMAQNIITEQKAEIAQMELFIKNHKVTEGEKHHQMGESMKSMMEKMNSMKMTGNTDKDYVMMMIPHHECAVSMAEAELAHGKQMELKKIAQNIISGQKKEITEFKSWKSIQK